MNIEQGISNFEVKLLNGNKKKFDLEDRDIVDKGTMECNELISIFVKSIETARQNNEKGK